MTEKTLKSLPIHFSESLFSECESESDSLVHKIYTNLCNCKTIYEQMNAIGVLKKECLQSKSINVIKLFTFLVIMPSCQDIRRCTFPILQEMNKLNSQITLEAYKCVTKSLITNKFEIIFEDSSINDATEIIAYWLSLPNIVSSVCKEEVNSISELFYCKALQLLQLAQSNTVVELKQQNISQCCLIIKNIALFCQLDSRILDDLSVSSWYTLCNDIMTTLCCTLEDTLAVSQLWVCLTYYQYPNVQTVVTKTEEIIHQVKATCQLQIMLYKELLIQLPFIELRQLHEGSYLTLLQHRLYSMVTSTVDETITLIITLFATNHQDIPSACVEYALLLILHHLDSSVRKVTKVSEDSLIQLIQSTPQALYNTVIQPQLKKVIEDSHTSRRKFSILLILLKCEPVSSLFALHSNLIPFLLSQFTERNSSFGAQVTTVLMQLIVSLYEEKGIEKRQEWLQMCIEPILNVVFESDEGRNHIFNYVLPALFDIKLNLLSKELKEEKKRVMNDPNSGLSLFTLDRYFIEEATKHTSDELSSALLILRVMKLEKELGVIGRNGDDYLGEAKGQLSLKKALQYASSGDVDIQLKLMDLITTTLFSTQCLSSKEWQILFCLFKNCYFVDHPRFRHDFTIAVQRLCDHLMNMVKNIIRDVKKSMTKRYYKKSEYELIKTIQTYDDLIKNSDLMNSEEHTMTHEITRMNEELTHCCNVIIEAIRPGLATHSLAMISGIVYTILKCFNEKSVNILNDLFTLTNSNHCIQLLYDQNAQIRENGFYIIYSFSIMAEKSVIQSISEQIIHFAFRKDGMLTDYEVNITSVNIQVVYELSNDIMDSVQHQLTCDEDLCMLLFNKPSTALTSQQCIILHLLTVIQHDINKMHNDASIPFTNRSIPSCQGAIDGLMSIIKHHKELINNNTSFHLVLLYTIFKIYKESLAIVADSSICEDDLNTMNDDTNEEMDTTNDDSLDELLSKGPVQTEDSGVITSEDHIAKDKLDCRGHIIESVNEEETKHLKELMLSAWLICKYSSECIAMLFESMNANCFEQCDHATIISDLSTVESYLKYDTLDKDRIHQETVLKNDDILYLMWDMLVSVLTIKHIGGIVFVADAITKILTRLVCMKQSNPFIASLPSFFVDLLLDESNINNRNFILRRSTGYSKAICSILTSLPSLVGSVLCHLFLLAAPSVDYFETLPSNCIHPSLVISNHAIKSNWKSRVHALNIIRQIFLDRRIIIDDYFNEPALMLAIEALVSPVWPVKNSGLMIYTVILKKILSNKVNENIKSNLTVTSFFTKYSYLKKWFALKLSVMNTEEVKEDSSIAGLHPILFSFIVLTSRLSGSTNDNDSWLTTITQAIAEVNSSRNLFCRTMSAKSLTVLIPTQDHALYVQCIIKQILTYPDISQNLLHGLLLQILFITKQQTEADDLTILHSIIADFMNNLECICEKAKCAFVKWTFLEIIYLMLQYTTQYDHVLSLITINQLKLNDCTVGDQLYIRSMYCLLIKLGLRIPLYDVSNEKYVKGLLAIKTVLKQTSVEEISLSLKRIRYFYRHISEQQRKDLYQDYFNEITEVIMNKLTSGKLPRYGLKAFLKTAVLFRDYIKEVDDEGIQVLLTMVNQTDCLEISYWACRLLWALLLHNTIHANLRNVCEKSILNRISCVDISLSYRSMLCDLCVMESEVNTEQVSFIQGVTSYCRLSLLSDTNPSIQKTILNLLHLNRESNLLSGFNDTIEEQKKLIFENEQIKADYNTICTAIITNFIHKHLPSDLNKERCEIYKDDSSCSLSYNAVVIYTEIIKMEEDDNENKQVLKQAIEEWKEDKKTLTEDDWRELTLRKTDKLHILLMLCDLF